MNCSILIEQLVHEGDSIGIESVTLLVKFVLLILVNGYVSICGVFH